MRYACFPEQRRLAVMRDGQVRVYDTKEHRITGFSQQQSGSQSLSFTQPAWHCSAGRLEGGRANPSLVISKYPGRQTRGHGRADFLAARQIDGANRFRRQDRFWCLRVRAHDQRRRDAQPPAGGDARDLPRGVFAVAAGANQRRVRPAVDAVPAPDNSRGRRNPSSHRPARRGFPAPRKCSHPLPARRPPRAPAARSSRTVTSGSAAARAAASAICRVPPVARMIDDQQRFHARRYKRRFRHHAHRLDAGAFQHHRPEMAGLRRILPRRQPIADAVRRATQAKSRRSACREPPRRLRSFCRRGNSPGWFSPAPSKPSLMATSL